MRRQVVCEPLERRRLLAGNIHLVDAYLADADGNRLASVAAGQLVHLQVEFTTTGLESAAAYRVNATLAGRTFGSSLAWGAGQPDAASWSLRAGPWLLGPAASSASVVLDAATSVDETNEADNARAFTVTPQLFAPRFAKPIEGTMGADWALTSFLDTDPSTNCRDFSDGAYCSDAHDGWDLALPNFAAMDRGHDVFASAAGTVVEVIDGGFDRQTAGGGGPGNSITLDHGNGWRTTYRHLKQNSILVQEGDTVAAGQPLALVGSSGASTDAHLHWSVTYNGQSVEPMAAAEQYLLWTQPYPSTLPSILDSGITSYDPAAELKERPSRAEHFRTAGGETVHLWLRTAGFKNGDELAVRWLRPDGSEHRRDEFVTGVMRYGAWTATLTLPPSAPAGTWRAIALINGVEASTATFQVLSTGRPQARMLDGPAYFVDGRTTPFDFGTVLEGHTGPLPTRTFTVRNSGAANLATSNLSVPAGYTVTEPLAATIAPGAADTFTLRLDSAAPGHRSGLVTFNTNDPSPGEDLLSFAITGGVTSIAEALAGLLTDGDDTLYIRRSANLAQFWVNRDPSLSPSLETDLARVPTSIDTRAGDDIVTLDFAAGPPVPPGFTTDGGAGDDALRVIGTPSADAFELADSTAQLNTLPLTLTSIRRAEFDGRDGADTFDISPEAPGVDEIIILGGNQSDTLRINDHASAGPDAYTLTATTFDQDNFGSLQYSGLESFTLSAGAGPNRIDVLSTPATLAVTINAGGGDDQINIAAGDLSPIAGAVLVDGQAGADRLLLDDHESPSGRDVTISATQVLPGAAAAINYRNLERLEVHASNAASTLTVTNTAPATPLTLRANGGTDTVRINETHPSAPVTIEPSAGDDAVTVNPDAAGSATVIFPASMSLGPLTLFTGARATLLPNGTSALRATSLTLLGNARLDLADNALLVPGGSLSQIRNAIASARNTSPLWQGPGLATSSAATPTQTLGVILNGATGGPLLTTLNGLAAAPDDVLVNFTLAGDTDLDGDIDISDFFAIDHGRALRRTGYANGDFDHDNGPADADDFMLIDRAFLSQGSALSPAPAVPAADLFQDPVTDPLDLGAAHPEPVFRPPAAPWESSG